MSVNCWLYVSKSLVASADAENEMQNIIEISQAKNPRLEITGALLYGGSHFAQLIEGPAGGIMALRSAILRDERHAEIKTLADGKVPNRSFQNWSLAYAGPSMVVSRALQRSLRQEGRSEFAAGTELVQLMLDIVAQR